MRGFLDLAPGQTAEPIPDYKITNGVLTRRGFIAGAAAVAAMSRIERAAAIPRGGGITPPALSAITIQNTGVTYSTMPAAIAAATSGQTILIPAGTYAPAYPSIPYGHWSQNFNALSHGDAFNNFFIANAVTFQGVGTANNGRAHLQMPYGRLASAVVLPPTGQDWPMVDVSLFDPSGGVCTVWGENDTATEAYFDISAPVDFYFSGIDLVNNLLLNVTKGDGSTYPTAIAAGVLLTQGVYNGQSLYTTNAPNPGIVFSNIEISGCWVDSSGGGDAEAIRMGASSNGVSTGNQNVGSVTLDNCYLHDNQMGLSGNDKQYGSGIFCHLYNTELYRNGCSDRTHNIYVASIDEFIFQDSYSHYTTGTHLVKTRARKNSVLYSKITGETTTTGPGSGYPLSPAGSNPNTSCNIDFSNGGSCIVLGCQFEQAYYVTNDIINMCAETDNAATGAAPCPQQELYVVNCSILTNAWQGSGNSPLFTRNAIRLNLLNVGNPEQLFFSAVSGGSLGMRPYLLTATCVDSSGRETSTGVQSSNASTIYPQMPNTTAYVPATIGTGTLCAVQSPVPRTGAASWNLYLAMQDPLFTNPSGESGGQPNYSSNIYTYAAPVPGYVYIAGSGSAVTGTNTTFTSSFTVGQSITANSEIHTIASITSDTLLYTTTDWIYTTGDQSPLSPTNNLAPIAASYGPVLGTAAQSIGSYPGRSYYFGITYVTAWGESINNSLLAVPYETLARGIGNNGAAIILAANTLAVVNPPPAVAEATGWNLYALAISTPGSAQFGPYNGTKQNASAIPFTSTWTEPDGGGSSGLLTGGPTLKANWYKQTASAVAIGVGWTEPGSGPVTGTAIPASNTALGSPIGLAQNNYLEYFVSVTGQAYDGMLSNTGYLTEASNILTNFATTTSGGPTFHPPIPNFVNESVGDYHLTSAATAISAGSNPGTTLGGTSLTPVYQFVDPGYGSAAGTPIPALLTRPNSGANLDVGAFEYGIGT